MGFWVHGKIDFTGFLIVTEFTQSGEDDSQKRVEVGEDSDDAGTALEFLVYEFDHVGGPHSFLMSLRKFKAVEAFRYIGFEPCCERRRALSVGLNHLPQ